MSAANRDLDLSATGLSGVGVTATLASPDQTNADGRGLLVFINLTANPGALGALTVTVQAKDPASGNYVTLLASAALAAVAMTTLTVYPGAAVTANVSASQVLPRQWRILTSNNGNPTSYTVGACVIA